MRPRKHTLHLVYMVTKTTEISYPDDDDEARRNAWDKAREAYYGHLKAALPGYEIATHREVLEKYGP